MKITTTARALLALALLYSGCAIPRMLMPRTDMEPGEIGDPSMSSRVLIASRDTDFKIDLAGMLADSLAAEPAYVKFVGIELLKDEDPLEYDAVVVMTSCIAWGIESKVDHYLSDHSESSNIILLVTSGDGGWKPDAKGRRFDAIATPSVKADAGKVAGEVLAAIRKLQKSGPAEG